MALEKCRTWFFTFTLCAVGLLVVIWELNQQNAYVLANPKDTEKVQIHTISNTKSRSTYLVWFLTFKNLSIYVDMSEACVCSIKVCLPIKPCRPSFMSREHTENSVQCVCEDIKCSLEVWFVAHWDCFRNLHWFRPAYLFWKKINKGDLRMNRRSVIVQSVTTIYSTVSIQGSVTFPDSTCKSSMQICNGTAWDCQ